VERAVGPPQSENLSASPARADCRIVGSACAHETIVSGRLFPPVTAIARAGILATWRN
jgi:hypothetical protein